MQFLIFSKVFELELNMFAIPNWKRSHFLFFYFPESWMSSLWRLWMSSFLFLDARVGRNSFITWLSRASNRAREVKPAKSSPLFLINEMEKVLRIGGSAFMQRAYFDRVKKKPEPERRGFLPCLFLMPLFRAFPTRSSRIFMLTSNAYCKMYVFLTFTHSSIENKEIPVHHNNTARIYTKNRKLWWKHLKIRPCK